MIKLLKNCNKRELSNINYYRNKNLLKTIITENGKAIDTEELEKIKANQKNAELINENDGTLIPFSNLPMIIKKSLECSRSFKKYKIKNKQGLWMNALEVLALDINKIARTLQVPKTEVENAIKSIISSKLN